MKPFDILDQLEEIADIIDQYGKGRSIADLMKREAERQHWDGVPLASDLQFALEKRMIIDGQRELRSEFIIRKLLFLDHGYVSNELKTRIDSLLDSLRKWERKYGDEVVRNGLDVKQRLVDDPTYFVEGADYLGRLSKCNYDAITEFEEISDMASEAAKWLRDFVRTTREKAKADEVNKTKSWPILAPQDLRKILHISQEVLLERLKNQAIPNVKIGSKAYKIDPDFLRNSG